MFEYLDLNLALSNFAEHEWPASQIEIVLRKLPAFARRLLAHHPGTVPIRAACD